MKNDLIENVDERVKMPNVVDVIEGSDAFKQFVKELDTSEVFSRCGWEVVHSAYFQDHATSKDREIDFVATQHWKQTKTHLQARLRIVCEVKTMAGFHLLFSARDATSNPFFRSEHWIGYGSESNSVLSSVLLEKGVSSSQVIRANRDFVSYCYPEESAYPAPMMITPPQGLVATAFRETNIGKEKDLDSSVFWRASSAVKSAIDSFLLECQNGARDEISGAYDGALLEGANGTVAALEWAKLVADYVDVLHPIVVTDAKLWALKDQKAIPIEWCRFARSDFSGSVVAWCDVVNAEHIEVFAEWLTNYYKQKFSEAGAEKHG